MIYIRETENKKYIKNQDLKYFMQCLLTASGIVLTVITLYFVGFMFL